MRITLKGTRLGLRNSTTRIPFRYGNACLTRCPQAILGVTIEADGRRQNGYAGDCLPPSWFDKSAEKNYARQIDDMLAVIALAEKTFLEEFAKPTKFFPAWLVAYERIHSRAAEWRLAPLLASFGVSMVERAILDAMARAASLSFFRAVQADLYAIVPADVHPTLAGIRVTDCLPAEPARRVFVRHTVGLGDPLKASDLSPDERLSDGFPQALEDYVLETGVRYFKIKVSNRLEHDLERLGLIARLLEQHCGPNYRVTIDGNEQYKTASDFHRLVEAIRLQAQLQTLWNNTLVIEQPLERSIALSPDHTQGIHELSKEKVVIVDESDGTLQSYAQAAQVGYRGVSSKNCKGPIRSLLNACLTWDFNGRGQRDDFLMTGEDLCTVGIVPVQSDLCLTAALGMTHVERNGHHYHPGLSYLPETERRAALEAHGDLYLEQHGIVAPRLVNGRFEIASLQCTGFGFCVEPDFGSMLSPDQWDFESLGLRQ